MRFLFIEILLVHQMHKKWLTYLEENKSNILEQKNLVLHIDYLEIWHQILKMNQQNLRKYDSFNQILDPTLYSWILFYRPRLVISFIHKGNTHVKIQLQVWKRKGASIQLAPRPALILFLTVSLHYFPCLLYFGCSRLISLASKSSASLAVPQTRKPKCVASGQ